MAVLMNLGIETNQRNRTQIPRTMGADIQKVIQKIKLQISHQMKHYSNLTDYLAVDLYLF